MKCASATDPLTQADLNTVSTVLLPILGSGPIPFPKRDWKTISVSAQDAISRCLKMDPAQRITASELLAHPWLKGA